MLQEMLSPYGIRVWWYNPAALHCLATFCLVLKTQLKVSRVYLTTEAPSTSKEIANHLQKLWGQSKQPDYRIDDAYIKLTLLANSGEHQKAWIR